MPQKCRLCKQIAEFALPFPRLPVKVSSPMRTLDRYNLKTFLFPWLCITLGFLILFIVIDLIDRIGDFLDGGAAPAEMVLYYLRFIPSVWGYIGPITLLLGLLFALYQLTRNNEIIAMRASGISIYRVMLPFMILGILFSLLTLYISENVAPRNQAWIDHFMLQMRGRDSEMLVSLRFRDPELNRTWDIQEMNPDTFEIFDVTVTQRHPDLQTIQQVVRAERAVWMDDFWAFHEVTIQQHTLQGHRQGPPEHAPVRLMQELTESPQRILLETMPFEHMTSREMISFLEQRTLSDRTRADMLTQLHLRRAQPWMCLVTIMLAVPFSTHTARKGVFSGVLLCLLLFFAMIFVLSLFKALGQGQQIPPVIAGWFPTLFFGSIGLYFLRHLR